MNFSKTQLNKGTNDWRTNETNKWQKSIIFGEKLTHRILVLRFPHHPEDTWMLHAHLQPTKGRHQRRKVKEATFMQVVLLEPKESQFCSWDWFLQWKQGPNFRLKEQMLFPDSPSFPEVSWFKEGTNQQNAASIALSWSYRPHGVPRFLHCWDSVNPFSS